MSAVFNERNLSRSYYLVVSATISTLYNIFLLTPIMRLTILVFIRFFALFVLSHFIFLFVSQLLKSPVDRLNYLVSRTVVPFIFRFCLFFVVIVSSYRLIYFSFDSFLFSYSFIYFFILAVRHSFFLVIFLSVFIFLSCFVVTHSHPPFIPVFDFVSSPLLSSSHVSYTFPHRILSFTLFFSILCLAVLP